MFSTKVFWVRSPLFRLLQIADVCHCNENSSFEDKKRIVTFEVFHGVGYEEFRLLGREAIWFL
jgi:hypothetical protein